MTQDVDDPAQLAAATRAVYERQAARFDRERPKGLHERRWLERFAERLPAGGRVLDVGCGAGEPFVGWFTDRGYRVTGLDTAEAMLAIARARHPEGDWRRADMRSLDLPERFDGIIGWHSFFHLTRGEQRLTLPRLARHLQPEGALMLTVGPDDGEAMGHVGGEPVYHASLSADAYASLLAENGLRVVSFVKEDPDCDLNSVLLARKQPA